MVTSVERLLSMTPLQGVTGVILIAFIVFGGGALLASLPKAGPCRSHSLTPPSSISSFPSFVESNAAP
jgi:hypothetical protein